MTEKYQEQITEIGEAVVRITGGGVTEVAHLLRDIALAAGQVMLDNGTSEDDVIEMVDHLTADLQGNISRFENEIAADDTSQDETDEYSLFLTEFSEDELKEVVGYLGKNPADFSSFEKDRYLAFSDRFANLLERTGDTKAAENIRSTLKLIRFTDALLAAVPAAGQA